MKLTAQQQRCHGDYHLRHVLYTGKDFVIVNLEGESALSPRDRRRKRSPLRDVASMLHSFHYCTRVALRQGRVRPEDIAALEPSVDFWNFWVAVTFLGAYREGTAAFSFLPETTEEWQFLLEYYLIRRAIADLWNEMGRRPERVQVPLEVLARVVEGMV